MSPLVVSSRRAIPQGCEAVKKSCVTGLGWRTPLIRCAFSGAIASLADLKGLRQPIFSQLLSRWATLCRP